MRIVSVPLSGYSRYGLTVARLSVDAGDDTFRGGEIIDDPVVIARHIAWRDLALQLAETYHEFVSWQS